MSYLVALEIQIPDTKVQPGALTLKDESIKFQILIGNTICSRTVNFLPLWNSCVDGEVIQENPVLLFWMLITTKIYSLPVPK